MSLAQVLIPGLEERARFLPQLEQLGQLTPGWLTSYHLHLLLLSHALNSELESGLPLELQISSWD